jgi:hypothetical protein
MSEHQEQALVVKWSETQLRNYPELSCLFAIPNLGVRFENDVAKGAALMARMKAQGLRPGMPDLCLPVARGGFNALFIEMKRLKLRPTLTKGVTIDRTKPTALQSEWHERLRVLGNLVVVCYTAEEAEKALVDYLESKYLRLSA